MREGTCWPLCGPELLTVLNTILLTTPQAGTLWSQDAAYQGPATQSKNVKVCSLIDDLERHYDLGLAAWRASLLLFNCCHPQTILHCLSQLAMSWPLFKASLITSLLILPPHCQTLALQSPFSRFKVNLLVTVDGRILSCPLWSPVMVIIYGLLLQSPAVVISYSHWMIACYGDRELIVSFID